jgi:hypothetical protein
VSAPAQQAPLFPRGPCADPRAPTRHGRARSHLERLELLNIELAARRLAPKRAGICAGARRRACARGAGHARARPRRAASVQSRRGRGAGAQREPHRPSRSWPCPSSAPPCRQPPPRCPPGGGPPGTVCSCGRWCVSSVWSRPHDQKNSNLIREALFETKPAFQAARLPVAQRQRTGLRQAQRSGATGGQEPGMPARSVGSSRGSSERGSPPTPSPLGLMLCEPARGVLCARPGRSGRAAGWQATSPAHAR